jgi:hypothetical protein
VRPAKLCRESRRMKFATRVSQGGKSQRQGGVGHGRGHWHR